MKKWLKGISVFLLCMMTLVAFSGCTKVIQSEVLINAVTKSDGTGFTSTYQKFTGHREEIFTGVKNEELSFMVETEGGVINILVSDEDGEKLYEGKEIETSQFSVVLPRDGKYTILIEAKDHKGMYSIHHMTKDNSF